MWASRYFSPRYWASRYWAKIGGGAGPSPDCDIAFQGKITDTISFIGTIQDIAFQGPLDAGDLAFIGRVNDTRPFQGIIVDDDLGFQGNLTDEIGLEGDLCED